MDRKTVGLIANIAKPGVADMTRMVRDHILQSDALCRLDSRTASLLGEVSNLSVEAISKSCDLIVCIGGDGTLIQLVHEAGLPLPPILGVNAGTLGFLTGIGPAGFHRVWDQVLEGNAMTSLRTLLSVDVVRAGKTIHSDCALNETVLSRGERSRLIRVQVEIDGVTLTEYNADGLIVATPTGSTAYSLSAGGPLISPDSQVFVVTPICPHVLTNRSVIVNDCSTITLHASGFQPGVCVTTDGRDPLFLEPGDVVRIRRFPEKVGLIFPEDLSFFELLRMKLKWSGSAI